MRKTIFLALFCIFTLGTSVVSAQTTENSVPKVISKGVLNGSAISLAKPAYPPAAKAVNAGGTVSVQVTIDEEGNVISATAVGGHPLLQAASVEAARQSKFKPTLLQGQPVKVTGIITYNFVAASSPLTVRQIGYALSLSENSMQWKSSSPAEIMSSFPAEWTEEKEILKNLETHLKNKALEKEKAQTTMPAPGSGQVNKPETEEKFKIGGEGFKIGTENVARASVGTYRAFAPTVFYQPFDTETAEKLRDLQAKIENRLMTEEKNLWAFRLGKLLGKTKAEIGDDSKTQSNLLELNQLMQNSPYQLAEQVLSEIREISQSFQQTSPSAETKARLEKLIERLSR